ncbi:hypothetical protein HYW43_05335 [Candidatus Daviesbacteria bacterium]|nr:hypothetical protein [Candidatus Daviesbacteria bacterium]
MTLTQVAILTKQIITISIFALALALISFIGYRIWYAYYLANLPPVEEKPDIKFGILPLPDFPNSDVSSSNFSYSLDTTTGGLPKIGVDTGFSKLVKVYFVTKTFASLLSPERSQNLAEKFDIHTDPKILSETNYLFSDQDKNLNIDLDTGNFEFSREASVSAQESLDDDNQLVSDFEKTLGNLNIPQPDLSKGRTRVVLLKKEGTNFIPTTLRSEANVAQISLWPQSLDDKTIFTPQYDTSLISAIVFKSAANLQNYLSLKFTYYPIDTSIFATYPIKTADEAFADLQAGKGIVIIQPPKPEVSITLVYLGYFLAQDYSPYLQPIFVFEGPQFVAYVPAITAEFQSPAK